MHDLERNTCMDGSYGLQAKCDSFYFYFLWINFDPSVDKSMRPVVKPLQFVNG